MEQTKQIKKNLVNALMIYAFIMVFKAASLVLGVKYNVGVWVDFVVDATTLFFIAQAYKIVKHQSKEENDKYAKNVKRAYVFKLISFITTIVIVIILALGTIKIENLDVIIKDGKLAAMTLLGGGIIALTLGISWIVAVINTALAVEKINKLEKK